MLFHLKPARRKVMSRVAFVTDTTCNLPDELTRRYNVHLVPVYVIFEDKSYKDYVEMPPAEFYRRLVEYKAAGKMPTTSQPSPEDFRAMYAALATQGYTDILSVHLTSKSSGTYQSAAIAAGMMTDVRVHVVDTLTTSMQMGFMLIEAMDAINAGKTIEQAIAIIEGVKARSCLYFTVTDVEHLAASGRTEGAEKATEAAVSVKPVIGVLDGVPKAIGAERSQRAALEKVIAAVRERMGTGHIKRLAIVNGNIAEKAAQWSAEAAQALGFDGQPYVVDFGPGLAVHFGPGLLGIAAQWE
jgi:DegV family protein with EDD domain